MKSRVQLRTFNGARFLHEVHHLLWTPPQLIGHTMDAGWNCRDHALVTGILLESFGHKCMLVHGEALYVRGPTAGSESISYTQRPHNWLLVEGVGAVDISIKSEMDCGGTPIHFPLGSVFANQWHPRGKGRAHLINDAAAFAQAEAQLPMQRNHATAVYLAHEAEHVHQGHVTHSAGWIRSALTQLLDDRHGDPVALYAALILHLRAFLTGDASGLSALSFDDAWARLASQQAGAVDRAVQLLRPAQRVAIDPRDVSRRPAVIAQRATQNNRPSL